LSGSGAFQLTFDYDTGRLREIHIVRSTGKRVLDDAAISALKLWRAEPDLSTVFASQ
jgi:TonB family protein